MREWRCRGCLQALGVRRGRDLLLAPANCALVDIRPRYVTVACNACGAMRVWRRLQVVDPDARWGAVAKEGS